MFPLSNWTELDVWEYITQERLDVPSIYFAHEREVFRRDGMLYAVSPHVELINGERAFSESVRYRTVGDMSCTGAVASTASALAEVVSGDRGHEDHRARRDARGRPRERGRHGGPQGCRLLLIASSATAPNEHGPAAPGHSGSVDDGKSTLIGRLLHDAKAILSDQLDDLARARRDAGPVAADRRPAGRARAGHHDRRRLPLLRHGAPLVHPGRHARPRAVHAQHGHRGVDRRPGHRARRRAQGRGRADQAPRVHGLAARHPAPRGRGQQDGPRRLRRGASSTPSVPTSSASPRGSTSAT